jgi:hypothetical protein
MRVTTDMTCRRNEGYNGCTTLEDEGYNQRMKNMKKMGVTTDRKCGEDMVYNGWKRLEDGGL